MDTMSKLPGADGLSGDALGRRVLIQRTALAGFRHHQAPRLRGALRKDTALTLERDPGNAYDADAVAVCWMGRRLGYLPRGENFVVARLMDRERRLSDRIEGLQPGAAPNRRIRVAVLMH